MFTVCLNWFYLYYFWFYGNSKWCMVSSADDCINQIYSMISIQGSGHAHKMASNKYCLTWFHVDCSIFNFHLSDFINNVISVGNQWGKKKHFERAFFQDILNIDVCFCCTIKHVFKDKSLYLLKLPLPCATTNLNRFSIIPNYSK